MPPKRRPPPPPTSVKKRSTRSNPLPPTPKDISTNTLPPTPNDNSTNAATNNKTVDEGLAEVQPLKKGDRSPALAVAKVVDPPASAKISKTSAKATRSSKSTTNIGAASKQSDILPNNNDDDEDDDDEESYNTAVDDDDNEDDDYKYTSDVDDYTNLSDLDDSEDELRTSFQKNSTTTKNRISGGPIPPDYTKMSEQEAAIAMTKYNKAK